MNPDQTRQHSPPNAASTAPVQPTGAATQQRTRRALLKASAAAPVIYTLPIGAGVAASSTCIDKEDNFEVLTVDEIERIRTENLQRGSKLDDVYVVYDDDEKVKASCWSSIHARG